MTALAHDFGSARSALPEAEEASVEGAAQRGLAPARPGRTFSARLHRRIDTLAGAWRDLQAEGGCTAYQRLEWIEPLLTAVPRGSEPLFVEILDRVGGDTLMILPLLRSRRFGLTTIEWLDLGVCDYAAPVTAPGLALSADETERVWAAVRTVLPRADLIRFAKMPAAMAGIANPLAGLRAATPAALKGSAVSVIGDPETLVERVCGRGVARDIARRRRRLAEKGEVRFVHARTPDEIETLFAEMLAQRSARFRDMGRFDLLQKAEIATFYRDTALRGPSDGLAQIFGIQVGGEWMALAYGLRHREAFHGIILSMGAETWKPFGPGIMIIADIMIWARREGLEAVDFTVGALPYKSTFKPTECDLFDLAEALSPAGFAVLAVDRAVAGAKAWIEARPELFARLRAVRQRARRWGKPAPAKPAPLAG